MIKHSLLATSIAIALAQQASAAPLLPIDARGLAMGNTGVASAKLAHAPQYNPALLSTANQEDDFAIIFPQFGIVAADEEMIDSVEALTDDEYSGSTSGDSIIDHFEGITDNLDNILTSGPSSIEQQLKALETLISNVPGNGGNNSTTSAQLTQATTDLNNTTTQLNGQTQELQSTTFDLTSQLGEISGRTIRGNLGVNAAVAIPSKTLAAAVSVSGTAYFSGRMTFSDSDKSLFNGYAEALNSYATKTQEYTQATTNLAQATANFEACAPACTGNEQIAVTGAKNDVETKQAALKNFEYEKDGRTILSSDGTTGDITLNDDDLTSSVHIVGVGITEVGLTFSREFEIAGEKIAIGITPKLQTIKTYNYVARVEEEDIEADDIKDTEQDFSDFNVDLGAAYQFGANNQWQAGIVAKNLLSKEYEAESNPDAVTGETTTTKINLDTQFRAGISHSTEWTVVAFDLDLMENDPIAFEDPTQYASIGAELDIYDTVQLRAGYRTNLSASDSSVASVGLGFSPFGVHLDIAAMANPSSVEKEAGVAMELGFYF